MTHAFTISRNAGLRKTSSPFPGVDPFIEDQEWSDFHLSFIIEVQAQLAPLLEPRNYARIARRTYIEGPEEQREAFLKIHKTDSREVVTVLAVSAAPRSSGTSSSPFNYTAKLNVQLTDDQAQWLSQQLSRHASR